MRGIFNASKSWEKQSVYDIDNGWRATVENCHYGEMVCRLDAPTGQSLPSGRTYWHCSNGYDELPAFARPWIKMVVKSAETTIVTPGFTKIYPDTHRQITACAHPVGYPGRKPRRRSL